MAEGRRWLEAMLAQDRGQESGRARAQALEHAGMIAFGQGDRRTPRLRLKESLSLFQEVDDKEGMIRALGALLGMAWRQGHPEVIRFCAEESRALLQEVGDKRIKARILNTRGIAACYLGDAQAGRAWLEESLAFYREAGDQVWMAAATFGLAASAIWRGEWREARQYLEESLRLEREGGAKDKSSAGLIVLGQVVARLGEYEKASSLAEEYEALPLLQKTKSRVGMAVPLALLGDIAYYQGEYEKARAYLEECVATLRELEDSTTMIDHLVLLSRVLQALGQPQRAGSLAEEALAIAQEMQHPHAILQARILMGDLTYGRKDYEGARLHYQESLLLAQGVENRWIIALSLEGFARLAIVQGQFQKAACLLGAASVLREATGAVIHPVEQREYHQHLDRVRDVLGKAAFTTAWEAGGALSQEQAIALALAESLGPVPEVEAEASLQPETAPTTEAGPSYRIPDTLWEQIEPLLPSPPPKKKAGRPRMPDRQAMEAILYVLHTGCAWREFPLSLGIASTVQLRFQEWLQAGVFDRIRQAGLWEAMIPPQFSAGLFEQRSKIKRT